MVLLDQNPESARTMIFPVAPARRTRGMSSSTKRFAPRAVFAAPFALPGVHDLAGVSPGGQQRVVAAHLGVAEARALLVVAVDLADRGVDVEHHRPVARAGAHGPGPAQRLARDDVELAEMTEGERAQERPDRRRVPSPDAATRRWSRRLGAHRHDRCGCRRP